MGHEGKKILYLGADTAFFKVLAAEFQRQAPGVNLVAACENSSEKIQSLIVRAYEESPALVFVDFSKCTDDYFHLARLLARMNKSDNFPLVGLHDYLAPAEQIKESFLCSVLLNYFKGAEVFDVVFGALALIGPTQTKEHGFATGKLALDVKGGHLCKVGFVTEKKIHFETNLDFSKGDEIRIKSHWMQKKLIPSGLVKVKKVGESLLFYNFRRYIEASFAWLDPLIIAEGDPPDRVVELKSEYDYAVDKAQRAMSNWIENNQDPSHQKHVRVLIIDQNLSFLRDQPRVDSYGYAIRIQPFLNDIPRELDAGRPQVIAFNCDETNDITKLQQLTRTLYQVMPDELPYIVVFNNDTPSKELQTSMNYPSLLAYDAPLEPLVMLKMAKMFHDKINSLRAENQMVQSALRVFLKKSNPHSIAEIEEAIQLVQLSETDGVLMCSRQLTPGTTLLINDPVNCYVTIAAHPQLNKAPAYYFLINGINETEKTSLRRFVNTIFFKDHDAAKLQELESFQSLNHAKWEELAKKKEEGEADASTPPKQRA